MFKILKRSRMLPIVFSIAAICFSSLLLAQDPAKPRRNDKPNPNNNPSRNPPNAGGGPKGGGGSGLGGYEKPPLPANDVPARDLDLVLGRPTDSSITLRVMPFKNGQGRVRYGVDQGKSGASNIGNLQTTDWNNFQDDAPLTIELTGLSPNTRYSYTWEYQVDGASKSVETPVYTFHTQRALGSNYVFTVTSDSHLDENSSGDVYLRTLANLLADQSDFHLELGDTFMTGKYKQPQFSYGHYLSQRYYLGSACHSVPYYLVLGNHDGESPARGDTVFPCPGMLTDED
ncbi:MAG: fibronectin type III domain-containing protein [Planctomycetota bacterium]|jgi:hypothetical protein